MTDRFPGRGEIPKPWDGRPPARYRTPDVNYDPDPPFVDQSDYDDPMGSPPDGPSRRMLAGIAAAVTVVVLAGLALWWFSAGPGRTVTAAAVAVTSSRKPPPATTAPVSTTDTASAYDVGSCFDEANSVSPGVELDEVPCAGNDAVFIINAVVPDTATCDTGAGSPDYKDHGYTVPDETAGVAYCASLVVPTDQCFVYTQGQPIERAACGSGPDVVRVLAIESAPNVADACPDKPNPDVWYYQSPTSGQYACVSRPTATSGPPQTPTAAG